MALLHENDLTKNPWVDNKHEIKLPLSLLMVLLSQFIFENEDEIIDRIEHDASQK